eukprot:6403587-Pyramimonas_sp.AAC.1
METPIWFADIALGAMRALARRLENRGEADVFNAAPYDVQAAYKQLVVRVRAMIELHKVVKQRSESTGGTALEAVLTPLSALSGHRLTVGGV